jgi:hypothetical protein
VHLSSPTELIRKRVIIAPVHGFHGQQLEPLSACPIVQDGIQTRLVASSIRPNAKYHYHDHETDDGGGADAEHKHGSKDYETAQVRIHGERSLGLD